MITRSRLVAHGLALLLLLAGCASQAPAPIESPQTRNAAISRAPVAPVATAPRARSAQAVPRDRYTVKRGDTLYAIAWRLGVDFRDLVRWNGLDNPDRILVGQTLRVTPPASASTTARDRPPAPPPPAALPKPAPSRLPVAPARSAAAPAARITPVPARGQWSWPADGESRRSVSATGSTGLQIRGTRGQDVRAAAAGQVVYSGSGLRGYGQLLILKHDERFLSAYAHNDALLVAEGAQVSRGQSIARMGDSGASEVMLHFEIRKGGKAVDPLEYLPPR